MDITVYLPDELGVRAKERELKLSRLLRDAVTSELERMDAVEKTLNEPQQYEVEVEDNDGCLYTGRITGKEIAFDDRSEVTVYLTDDERVILYDGKRLKYWQLDDPEKELGDALPPAAYAAACDALGVQAVIDL